jgi:hypothetical protein
LTSNRLHGVISQKIEFYKYQFLIKLSYDGDTYQMVHDGRLSEPIPTTAGVKQGYIISPVLFIIVMGEVMRNVTEGERRRITWCLSQQLEDLDFADDMSPMSYIFK